MLTILQNNNKDYDFAIFLINTMQHDDGVLQLLWQNL